MNRPPIVGAPPLTTDPDRADRFTVLAEQVWMPLHRYLARRAPADDVDDVATETLTVMWRRLDDAPAGAELAWCYSIARRCLANHRRSVTRRRRLTDRVIGRLAADGRDVDRQIDNDPAVAVDASDPQLQAALAQLSADDRELLTLWAWEQLEVAEIALTLGASPNTISVRLGRARRRLATLLGERESTVADTAADASGCHVDGDAGHKRDGTTRETTR